MSSKTTTTPNLNMRQGAGTKHKVVTVFRKGVAVTPTGKKSGEWVQVKASGKTGWVSSAYLKTTKSAPKKTIKNGTTETSSLQTTANLNMRKGAGTKHKVVTTLKKGTKVVKTGKTSGEWWQVKAGNKTGWVSSAYLKTVTASSPKTVSKKPTAAKAKIKTAYGQKHKGLTYAIIDGGINWSKPVGKMVFLDGDYWKRGYKKSTSEHPKGKNAQAMAKVAAKRNMVLVVPRIPSSTKKYGYTWWVSSGNNAPMLKSLDEHIDKQIGGSKARTWYMGYSGGAEYITHELATRGQSSYGYGGAIILAGGGVGSHSYKGASSTFKKNFDMHWFVGSKDGTGQSSNAKNWSAFKATQQGQNFYKSKGFKTTRTVLKGHNHHSYNLSSVMEQGLRKGGL